VRVCVCERERERERKKHEKRIKNTKIDKIADNKKTCSTAK